MKKPYERKQLIPSIAMSFFMIKMQGLREGRVQSIQIDEKPIGNNLVTYDFSFFLYGRDHKMDKAAKLTFTTILNPEKEQRFYLRLEYVMFKLDEERRIYVFDINEYKDSFPLFNAQDKEKMAKAFIEAEGYMAAKYACNMSATYLQPRGTSLSERRKNKSMMLYPSKNIEKMQYRKIYSTAAWLNATAKALSEDKFNRAILRYEQTTSKYHFIRYRLCNDSVPTKIEIGARYDIDKRTYEKKGLNSIFIEQIYEDGPVPVHYENKNWNNSTKNNLWAASKEESSAFERIEELIKQKFGTLLQSVYYTNLIKKTKAGEEPEQKEEKPKLYVVESKEEKKSILSTDTVQDFRQFIDKLSGQDDTGNISHNAEIAYGNGIIGQLELLLTTKASEIRQIKDKLDNIISERQCSFEESVEILKSVNNYWLDMRSSEEHYHNELLDLLTNMSNGQSLKHKTAKSA